MRSPALSGPNGGGGPSQREPIPYHTRSVEEAIRSLETSPRGLDTQEANRRLAAIGPNELEAPQRASAWVLLAAQFKNVLIVILLIAVGLSIVLGHGLEAIVIGVIVVFAVLLGFIQEYRAERAIEALQEMAAPTACVIRDGAEQIIAARELVPGDLVLLRVGDRIPADLRLIDAVNLQCDEAALTGESVPIEKQTRPVDKHDVAVADRRDMAYSGTVVTYGRGKGAVTATGMHTEFGRIAGMLQTVETSQTPLQENLDRVGKVLAVAALAVVAIIVVLGVIRGQDFLEMLLFGIALAVAVVPEALPAVVTISLAMGVRRIVKRNALIRRLPAVETLGSTSVICSDKTGTLTRNEMTVRRVVAGGTSATISGSGYDPHGEVLVDDATVPPPPLLVDLLRVAVLASDATLADDADGRRAIRGDPTEGALVVAAAKVGMDKDRLDARYPRTAELPFTSERKQMTTLHADGERAFACSKGAAEVVLAACTDVAGGDRVTRLDKTTRRDIIDSAESLAREGIRVLGVATKSDTSIADAEEGMTFLGLVGLVDPPRPEAAASVAACADAGIGVVMITGDHPVTAAAIADDVGIFGNGRVITGRELEQMTDDELTEAITDIQVYARVSPADKLRIVTAWQERDAVVAMTGDGVNDAPALKKSDIGVAMAITGTDVSREAADMVLLDDNFASIVAAVEEGRGIFGNIKKYLMYLISSNVGETLLIAATTVAGMPLPLSAVQILYVNLATDGLPALALSVDPPEADLMHRGPRDRRRGIFTRPVVTLMALGGLWSAIVNVAVFATTRAVGGSVEEAMANTFVSLVLIQFFKAYNFRSDRRSVFDQPFANRWLNLAVSWEVLLLVAIIYVPILQDAFGTSALGATEWIALTAAAASIVPVLETAKWMERRGWLGEMD